jgi:PAS domain S-box-containing protein
MTDDRSAEELVQITLLGEALAQAVGAAVFVWDEARNYVAVNDAACRLVGLSREELLAMKVGDMTPDRAAPHFEEAQRRPLLRGVSTISRHDGSEVAVEWVTVHTKVGELPYMVSLCWRAGGSSSS